MKKKKDILSGRDNGANATVMLPDLRNIKTGYTIPTKSYCDQPYIVKADDGAWVLCVTTGASEEGQPGQHIISMRSTDRGRTWSSPVELESPAGPEASYSVLYKAPYGRIYAFYNYNSDNLRMVKANPDYYPNGLCPRVDSQGQFVFKYSDDNGKSWSAKRYPIEVREFEIDRQNPYGGRIRFFWNVGKPFVLNDNVYVSLHKVGSFGRGFFERSEGAFLKSCNISREKAVEKIVWETLPDGEFGLCAPPEGDLVAEEQSTCVLSDGSLYCVYRSIDGYPAETYSRDGGHTWERPRYKTYANGKLMKHPRAANFVWRLKNGKYLYWFHNHGGNDYNDRNPAWLCAGEEADSPAGRIILWSQPEIFLYDDDPNIRISYPDLIEDGDDIYITETQKNIARIHRVEPAFLKRLFGQFCNRVKAEDGLIASLISPMHELVCKLPDLIRLDKKSTEYSTIDLRAGFTIDFCIDTTVLKSGVEVVSNRASDGRGLLLSVNTNGELELEMSDARSVCLAKCDKASLAIPGMHHICVIVDGGPKLILFVVDGILMDGGKERQFGWTRFNPLLRSANGCKMHTHAGVKCLTVYSRAIMVSEAVGNYHAHHENDCDR